MTEEAEPAVGGEVIVLRPEQDMTDDQRMLLTTPRKSRSCLHRRYRLDGDSRRVYCRDCDMEVPAFEALDYLARDVEVYINQRQEAIRRAKVAHGEMKETERLTRNAKGRLRTAMKRAPACSCTAAQRSRVAARWRAWMATDLGVWCPKCGGKLSP